MQDVSTFNKSKWSCDVGKLHTNLVHCNSDPDNSRCSTLPHSMKGSDRYTI